MRNEQWAISNEEEKGGTARGGLALLIVNCYLLIDKGGDGVYEAAAAVDWSAATADRSLRNCRGADL